MKIGICTCYDNHNYGSMLQAYATYMSEAIGTREFAEKYGVTQATVSKWCREGKIPNCNQDGKGSPWHIPKDALPPVGYKQRKK